MNAPKVIWVPPVAVENCARQGRIGATDTLWVSVDIAQRLAEALRQRRDELCYEACQMDGTRSVSDPSVHFQECEDMSRLLAEYDALMEGEKDG